MNYRITRSSLLGAAVALLACAGPAFAEDSPINSGDTAWMLVSTALVLMMTIPGLALFYGGMVRKKNVLATVMQSFAITCLVTVIWMIAGYSLAFTNNGSESLQAYIGGLSRFLLNGMGVDAINPLAGTIPESVFMTFQMTFAIITPALACAGFADRMKFSAMMWFMGLWSIFVYSPVAHWVWGGGFLGTWGVLDFAGGTVVHINAGVAALVCALVIGKRVGFGTDNMAPHNLVYSLIGASLLWVGWFGFNAGSAVRLQRPRRHGHGRHSDRHRSRCARLDVRRVDRARQAERPRHHLRRGRRTGGDHAGLRLRRRDRLAHHRHHRRHRLLLGGDLAQAASRL